MDRLIAGCDGFALSSLILESEDSPVNGIVGWRKQDTNGETMPTVGTYYGLGRQK
jgi:hypothetical protein